jgi:hypothetical protein
LNTNLSVAEALRHPRSFGLLIRLYLGVEVVFISEWEPWRKGVIERFH